MKCKRNINVSEEMCMLHLILLFIYFLENYSSFMFLQVTYISIFCVECSVVLKLVYYVYVIYLKCVFKCLYLIFPIEVLLVVHTVLSAVSMCQIY